MKRFLAALLLMTVCMALCASGAAAFRTAHTYLNGKVDSISGNLITIAGTTFQIHSKCRVVIVSGRNGAYFEDPASLRDVSSGYWVTVRQTGNLVDEIMIERWRR